MEITFRGLVTMVHGMLFGGFFLMAVFGVVVVLWRSEWVTEQGYRWETAYLVVMVLLGWAAVLSGAYVVYPWYRAPLPAGVMDLTAYPRLLLLSKPNTAGWHSLGMEWKEHVAWMAPIAMTAVAYVMVKYRGVAEEHRVLRRQVLVFAAVALFAAGVAGGFGALIDKAAPVEGGRVIHLMGGAK